MPTPTRKQASNLRLTLFVWTSFCKMQCTQQLMDCHEFFFFSGNLILVLWCSILSNPSADLLYSCLEALFFLLPMISSDTHKVWWDLPKYFYYHMKSHTSALIINDTSEAVSKACSTQCIIRKFFFFYFIFAYVNLHLIRVDVKEKSIGGTKKGSHTS